MGCIESSQTEEFYSNINLLQETSKISNKQSNITFKTTKEQQQKNIRASERKEIIRMKAKINEIKMS